MASFQWPLLAERGAHDFLPSLDSLPSLPIFSNSPSSQKVERDRFLSSIFLLLFTLESGCLSESNPRQEKWTRKDVFLLPSASTFVQNSKTR